MELYRHYGNVRFATLTLFSGVVGGLLAISYGLSGSLPKNTRILLDVGGLLATGTFWVMEISAVLVWLHCVRRAAELEINHLGFRILSTMRDAPRFRILPTTVAVSAFYLAAAIFWAVTIRQHRLEPDRITSPAKPTPAVSANP